jgi:nitroimidazol reductase NimA-like FMN-containing flavoprotein (pyridoxamine 5'-phosphate oxidase superfamily)
MSDESIRRHVMGLGADSHSAPDVATTRRKLVELTRDEALRLLAGVRLGRIVFTRNALPAIRPVNHIVEDGAIIMRTHGDSAIAGQTSGTGIGGVVVAYEADQIDPETHKGWSVVITGYARKVTDLEQIARYQAMLEPWVEVNTDYAVRIRPDIVNGFRLR